MFRNLAPSLKRGLSSLLAPAEDPRRLPGGAGAAGEAGEAGEAGAEDDAAIQQQRDAALLGRVHVALTTVEQTRTRLERTAAQVDAVLTQARSQADRARQLGDEPAAHILHAQCAAIAADRQALEEQLRAVTLEDQRLRLAERRLQAQVETLRARRQVAAARYSAAAAEVQAGQALSGLVDSLKDLHLDLERAESEAEAMGARAAAIHSLLDEPA